MSKSKKALLNALKHAVRDNENQLAPQIESLIVAHYSSTGNVFEEIEQAKKPTTAAAPVERKKPASIQLTAAHFQKKTQQEVKRVVISDEQEIQDIIAEAMPKTKKDTPVPNSDVKETVQDTATTIIEATDQELLEMFSNSQGVKEYANTFLNADIKQITPSLFDRVRSAAKQFLSKEEEEIKENNQS